MLLLSLSPPADTWEFEGESSAISVYLHCRLEIAWCTPFAVVTVSPLQVYQQMLEVVTGWDDPKAVDHAQGLRGGFWFVEGCGWSADPLTHTMRVVCPCVHFHGPEQFHCLRWVQPQPPEGWMTELFFFEVID